MNHKKKMMAPIIVTVIMILYLTGIGILYTMIPGIPSMIKVILIGIPAVSICVMIGVLISRMKEIRSGEEDDLSKY